MYFNLLIPNNMRVAMFIRNNNMKAIRIDAFNVLVLDIEDNTIKGMENDCLYNKNINYISLWLINKEVSIIYVEDADDDLIKYFKRLDITVKKHKDLERDPILKVFMI